MRRRERETGKYVTDTRNFNCPRDEYINWKKTEEGKTEESGRRSEQRERKVDGMITDKTHLLMFETLVLPFGVKGEGEDDENNCFIRSEELHSFSFFPFSL